MPFKKGQTPPGAKPFVKGKSGNPKGQPRKIPQLDKLLADVLGEEKDGIEAAKAILMALRAKATKGDVRAAEVLLDRAYGKAKQNFGFTDGEGKDVQPQIIFNPAPGCKPIEDDGSNPT
jgi:hypothetical protein